VTNDGDRASPAFPIRLIALDLDGTLIDDELVLRDRTKAAIAGALDRGVGVSIVTGRMATSAMAFARELRLVDPIVGYQGAIIRAIPNPDRGRLGRGDRMDARDRPRPAREPPREVRHPGR
jgi:hydroxymethylpyrimidine pyrophosphatase-like HAD family hydrolase